MSSVICLTAYVKKQVALNKSILLLKILKVKHTNITSIYNDN